MTVGWLTCRWRDCRAGYVEKTIRQHRHDLRDPDHDIPEPAPDPSASLDVEQIAIAADIDRVEADDLDDHDRDQLNKILARSSILERLAYHVTSFAEMMTGLHGERLDEWITAVEADDFPQLHSFTAGLARDRAAVVNGLTMDHNSCPVEGAVSRLKSIKRSMFGQAKFDLLRKKILCRV